MPDQQTLPNKRDYEQKEKLADGAKQPMVSKSQLQKQSQTMNSKFESPLFTAKKIRKATELQRSHNMTGTKAETSFMTEPAMTAFPENPRLQKLGARTSLKKPAGTHSLKPSHMLGNTPGVNRRHLMVISQGESQSLSAAKALLNPYKLASLSKLSQDKQRDPNLSESSVPKQMKTK